MSSRAKRDLARTARGDRADPSVSLRETRDLLFGPLPALLVAGGGTVLGGNLLGAWICRRPSILALLLENIYAISGQALSEDWIPRSCNGSFIQHKQRVLKRLDPNVEWPAHRIFADAVKRARADQRPKVCPITTCVQVAENIEWRYPLCLWRPDRLPGEVPGDLLQFVVSDLEIFRTDVDELGDPISELEARYVILFEPADSSTQRALDEVRHQFATNVEDYTYPPESYVDSFVTHGVESLRQIIRNYAHKMTGERESDLVFGAPDTPAGHFSERTTQEIAGLHPGEWIALRVTEYDDDHWPVKGIVVTHSPDRTVLSSALEHDDPTGTHYVFQAVPHLDDGPVYDQTIKAFVAEFAAAKVAAGVGRSR